MLPGIKLKSSCPPLGIVGGLLHTFMLMYIEISQFFISKIDFLPSLFHIFLFHVSKDFSLYVFHFRDLSYNQLTRLDETAFVGLNLLEKLNLSDNRVSHIADGVFKGLSNLQTL